MNKNELVAAIAEKAGLTKVEAKNALDAAVAAISEALAKGDKVSLIGFGTFGVTERAERQGRNPLTGESITIAACRLPKFTAGAKLKEAVAAK